MSLVHCYLCKSCGKLCFELDSSAKNCFTCTWGDMYYRPKKSYLWRYDQF